MIAKVRTIDGLEKIHVVDSTNFVFEFKTDKALKAFMKNKGKELIGRIFVSPLHRFQCCLALNSEEDAAKVFKKLIGGDYRKNI